MPVKEMALQRCMAMEMCWNKNAPSRVSPVAAVILRPSSARKDCPETLIGPRDSKANGQKTCDRERSVYFAIFFLAAISAALPAVSEVEARYDAARVSAIVTFQVRHLPACHGICVRPSGLFPSDRSRTVGSLMAGMLARVRARHTRSLICWWRFPLPYSAAWPSLLLALLSRHLSLLVTRDQYVLLDFNLSFLIYIFFYHYYFLKFRCDFKLNSILAGTQ